MPRGGPLKLIDAAANRDQTFPLHELRLTVERTVEGVRAGLPARPLCLEPSRADWLLLEAQPDQTSDVGQADLMVASTCAPEMLKCYLQAAPFSSLRFSRCGERFAYLKYRASGEFAARVEARQVLEDELDRELRARGLGCVVGNGVGSAHCYIDFALLDVDSAIALVCEWARAAELWSAAGCCSAILSGSWSG
jgi:hypothetical protein